MRARYKTQYYCSNSESKNNQSADIERILTKLSDPQDIETLHWEVHEAGLLPGPYGKDTITILVE